MSPLLSLVDLTKSFGGVRAVDGVSLEVGAGRMVALIGPNGAGKSTCFHLISGLLRPDAGRVLLAGQDIAGLPQRRVWRLGLSRTFQIASAFGSMTVLENAQLALTSHRGRMLALWPRAEALYRPAAQALLERVGLGHQAQRPCAELAYGDLKRLELALALANDPRVLLMDEPTAGLSAAERQALMAQVRERARQGLAVLFTEHDMDMVFAHADEIWVLHRGQVIAHGAPATVASDARVREVYLGSPLPAPAPAGPS